MDGKEKNLELKKHVATIHSSNKLSLLQRKIANALLFNAYDHLQEKDEHEIHIRDLCKLIGYDSNDYKTIKKSLINLLSTVIEWNLVDGNRLDKDGVWNASSIIADASIDGAVCTYSYSNKMKKLLYHPELYGRLNMAVQAKFKSSYGLALYENCIRYQNIGQTPWIDILNFRKLMGVEEGKYNLFRDFKNRVIDIAVKEVNKYSPINIEIQLKKESRQVVSMQFLIKSAGFEKIKSDTVQPMELTQVLKQKFGLSKKQIEEIIANYDENYIKQKIEIVESSPSFINGKIANLAKYIMSAIKDDYQPTKGSKKNNKINLSEEAQKQQALKQEHERTYRYYSNKQIMSYFSQLPEQDKQTLLSGFEKIISQTVYSNIYYRDGLKDTLIQDQLCLHIKQMKHNLLEKIIPFEDYVNTVVSIETQEESAF